MVAIKYTGTLAHHPLVAIFTGTYAQPPLGGSKTITDRLYIAELLNSHYRISSKRYRFLSDFLARAEPSYTGAFTHSPHHFWMAHYIFKLP